MICLRCGYCCTHYTVVVVDNPELGPRQDNLKVVGDGTPCHHLIGDTPGKYRCALHHYPWYKETPCFRHGQIERGNTYCRMGQYIMLQKVGKDASKKRRRDTKI